MRFLADMGVDIRVVNWLRTKRHDVIHLQEQGLQKSPDQEIFLKAWMKGRILITFDLDFGEIIALSPGSIISVILFQLNDTRALEMIDRLSAVLSADAKALKKGAIILVDNDSHRVRSLPIGDSD